MRTKSRFAVFDNTLRDGEQAPGVHFSVQQKMKIASQLAAAGCKNLEAGFAGISQAEEESIRAVVGLRAFAYDGSLARLRSEDIEAACRSRAHGITLLLPVSEALGKIWLKGDWERRPELLERMAYLARERGLRVRVSLVDATRASISDLGRWIRLAELVGAEAVSLPDTVGCSLPNQVMEIFRTIRPYSRLRLSFHGHNDLGLALANSLAAIEAGADEIQATVNGLGERCGNTALEELYTAARLAWGETCGLDGRLLRRLSKTVARYSRIPIARAKPVVGKHAFSHESGMHAQALLNQDAAVIEAYPPAWVGQRHRVVFGKHSGLSNLRFVLKRYRLRLPAHALRGISEQLKKNGAGIPGGLWQASAARWLRDQGRMLKCERRG